VIYKLENLSLNWRVEGPKDILVSIIGLERLVALDLALQLLHMTDNWNGVLTGGGVTGPD